MPGPVKKDDGSELTTNLDTGMGGFSIDGNLQTYDVGNPDAHGPQKETPRVKTINTNIDIDPASGKHRDISRGTRTKLSNYLSNVTKGVEGYVGRPNRFVVEGSYESTPSVSNTTEGYPTPPSKSNNSSVYVNVNQNSQGSGLNSFSPAYPTIQSLMKKGATPGNNPDGHELLIDATSLLESIGGEPGVPSFTKLSVNSPIKKYTSAVLKSNRFTNVYGNNDLEPTSNGIPDNGKEADAYYVPKEKGKNYLKDGTGDVTSISSARMKSIGLALSMRASQEIATMDINAPLNPNNAGNWLLAQLPSPEQLGIWKPESFTTNAGDVLNSVRDDIGGSGSVNEVSISKRTWGALNNINDVFTGADAVGMSLLATVLAGASIAAIEILLLTIWNGNKPEQKTKEGNLYRFGESHFEPNVNGSMFSADNLIKQLNKFLGVPYVKNKFELCVRKGYNEFFRPILGGTLTGNLGQRAADLVNPMKDMSSGYYVVASRNIIRSIVVFAEYAGNLNWTLPGSYLKVLELLRNSRLFSIIHLFAQNGDKIITQEQEKHNDQYDLDKLFSGSVNGITDPLDKISATGEVEDKKYNSRIDSWQNKIGTKIDIAGGGKAAKFAIAAAIGNRVIESNVVTASLVWSADKSPDLLLSNNVVDKRISSEVASQFEQYLDSQYVPFYFHDLRTNEILSFHAFLDNISDSYTPTYDSSDAIGRIEPIQTYKSTQRKFGFSFFIVSTGENDIDVMYAKINKLTTLVYPQFTAGKQIQIDEKNKYTQPFSQLVGAAPLIRIRLGDLATSNYTRHHLAKLFGWGEDDKFSVDGKENNNDTFNDVFDEKNNSIVKYFNNNRGRGLAGYIDSLEFDWTNNIPWEIKGLGWNDVKKEKYNGVEYEKSSYYRAPKMCKVSLGFMPMFDITPGLDHLGRNRAPVYQVGYYRSVTKKQNDSPPAPADPVPRTDATGLELPGR